jgi:hypothetical protein
VVSEPLLTGSVFKVPGEHDLEPGATMLLLFYFPPLEWLYKRELNEHLPGSQKDLKRQGRMTR